MTISDKEIEQALQAEDVEGLIALGAPADEYAMEAEKIANILQSLTKDELNEKNIAAVIASVWAEMFNRSAEELLQRAHAFQRIATQLYKSNHSS